MVAIATLTAGFWAGSVQAQENGTRDEAKAMVEAAVEHVRKAVPNKRSRISLTKATPTGKRKTFMSSLTTWQA
jgi:hypothetical protein